MEKQAWIQAARQLAAQELPVQPLLRLPDAPDEPLQAALLQARGGVLADSAAAAIGCGVPDPRAVFLSADAPEDALRAAHGRCRYLAQTPEELQKLDALGYSNLYDLGGILSWPYEIEGDFEGHF